MIDITTDENDQLAGIIGYNDDAVKHYQKSLDKFLELDYELGVLRINEYFANPNCGRAKRKR